MSTVAYKHSLRHHVSSGHSQHSPPPSPPETPKSATASLKSHGSKREKVKETVDHLLHKFHIPHHHHHEHEDTLHAPVTPEKKSLLAKRASFAASLRPGSLKRKSVVADVDVPTLNYKTSPTLSASSSLHDDRHSRFSSSGSSNTAAEDESVTGAHQGVESPKSLKSPSRLLAPSSTTKTPASVSSLAKKTTPISAAAVVEPLAKPTAPSIASEHHHHHSKREAIKDAADHVLHKLHIPHHHHSHPRSASFTESTLTSSSSFSAGRSSDELDVLAPAASAEVVIPEDEEDGLATTLPKLPLDVDDVFTEPKTSVAEPAEEHVESLPGAEQAGTAPTAPAATVNEEKSVDTTQADTPPAVDAPLVQTKVLVECTTQTDDVADIPLQDIPRADHATSLIPSRSTQTTPHSTLTFAPRKSTYTPITIPTYIELRKATEAHRRTIKAEKPSWIRYIYGSFIKPVVVVAVECTVAAVCYGLVKVLERRPQALKSDQLKLA